MSNKKNSKNNNLILLQSIKDEIFEELLLNEEQEELKQKLLSIEKKLESVEKVVENISKFNRESIYNSNAFNMIVGSIAITAAIGTIAEYFGVKTEDIDNLLN